jgi:molybdate transport system substrate-binding protein
MLSVLHGQAQTGERLRIAAAADLQPVLPPIIGQFEQQTGIRADVVYASSATLATQILHGAPFAVFLSADFSFPEKAAEAGLTASRRPVAYAQGTLVLWARKDSPAQPISLESLRRSTVRTVAIANPEHAPYGRAAKAAIEKLGLVQQLQGKLVTAENIAQAAQYADTGNADAGFISLTSALTPRLREDGSYKEIPPNAYPAIVQGAVVIKGQGAEEGAKFLSFLLSPTIRKQLDQAGLKAP